MEQLQIDTRITYAWAPPHSDRPVPLIHCESFMRAPAPSHRPPIPSRWASAGVWVSCVAIVSALAFAFACNNNGAPHVTHIAREHMQGLLWLHAFKHSIFVPSMQCVNGLFSCQLQAIGAKGFIDVVVHNNPWCELVFHFASSHFDAYELVLEGQNTQLKTQPAIWYHRTHGQWGVRHGRQQRRRTARS
jgi:hypothetical protein